MVKEIVQTIPINADTNGKLINFKVKNCLNKFDLITPTQMNKIIYSLSQKSNSDIINLELIKKTNGILIIPITDFVNASLQESYIPEEIKSSLIIPIQKVNNSIKAEDMRPINTLPTIEKILEKAVYEQLKTFVNKNEILVDEQAGFRETFSTETALQLLLEIWKNALDNGKVIVVVFLDLKRAFATIDRETLIKKN